MAKMIAWKYAHLSGEQTVNDFEENHKCLISKTFVQNTFDRVGDIFADNEPDWSYELPEILAPVSHITISRDGTTSPVLPSGYRETMAGTLSFYQKNGERMHTIYVGTAPESGKQSFNAVMDNEISKVKALYPSVNYTAVADGAKDNWAYLSQHTSVCVLDYYHASEYLAANSSFFSEGWLTKANTCLKTESGGAKKLLKQLKHCSKKYPKDKVPDTLSKSITYFSNNLSRMDYPAYVQQGFPIGSGVTEAACKTLVKQRLSQSGMRWHLATIDNVLLVRGLVLTQGRWTQAWNFYDKSISRVTS